MSWSWSYGSWIDNYLCNLCLSPLMLWVRLRICGRCITLCDKVCQWLAAGRWFSPGTPVSSTNITDRHYITEILLKVAINTIKPNQNQSIYDQIEINRPFLKTQLVQVWKKKSNFLTIWWQVYFLMFHIHVSIYRYIPFYKCKKNLDIFKYMYARNCLSWFYILVTLIWLCLSQTRI